MFEDMIGGARTYILSIGVAVVFSLVLVAGTTMAMSLRERTTEIAVLKAIGFSQARVLGLVLGEACLIGLLGGLLGIGLGCLFLQGLNGAMPQIFPMSVWDMAGLWLLWLLAVAAGVGLASGLIPAVRAAQLSVVQGLRQVV
jgi:putative ABC transport system permease protein